MNVETGQVHKAVELMPLDDGTELSDVQTVEKSGSAEESISTGLTKCQDGTGFLRSTLFPSVRLVDTMPPNRGGCEQASGPQLRQGGSSIFPLADLLGKGLCTITGMKGQDDENLAVEAAGPPGANGVPPVKLTYAFY